MREQQRGMIMEAGMLILRVSIGNWMVHGECICMQYYGGQILYLTLH